MYSGSVSPFGGSAGLLSASGMAEEATRRSCELGVVASRPLCLLIMAGLERLQVYDRLVNDRRMAWCTWYSVRRHG